MTPERSYVDHLEDILTAAQKGIAFLGSMSLTEFSADERTAFAVVRALEILGEAAKRIPTDIRDKYPTVPWRAMADIRDKLIHDYFNVNLEVVWKTVKEDLPALVPQIEQIVHEAGE
jgi:uncharacterized protein with HEPN domain